MKKHFILAAMAITALFTGCSNEEIMNQEEDNILVNFTIGGIDSRATTSANFSTTFDNNDAIGISGRNLSTEMNNVEYTVSVSNGSATIAAANAETSFTYEGDKTAVFNAYYPYAENFANAFAVQTNQSNGISSSDFLTATATGSKDNATVSLDFKHRLVLVQVTLSGVENVSSVTLKNAKTGVTFTPSTNGTTQGTVTLATENNEATDITMYQQTENKTYWAIVPAQEIAAGELFIVSTSNGKTYKYTATQATNFAEGTLAKYSLTLAAPSILVAYNPVSITAWNTNGIVEQEGNLEEDKLNLSIATSSIVSGGMVPKTTTSFTNGWRFNNGTGSVITEDEKSVIKYVAPTTLSTNWYNDGISYYCNENLKLTSTYKITFKVKGNVESQSLHAYVAINNGTINKIFKVTQVGASSYDNYSIAPIGAATNYVERTFVISPNSFAGSLSTNITAWSNNDIATPFAIVFKPKTASTAAEGENSGVETIYYFKDISIVEL